MTRGPKEDLPVAVRAEIHTKLAQDVEEVSPTMRGPKDLGVREPDPEVVPPLSLEADD
jgi:hypothetical protein